ncbi:MAG TPA: RIP metalloprotease RseP [Vicinamibacterales bacterium]|nr:RIP metalloprotease RseP [Vicinamibacterales bacterium]
MITILAFLFVLGVLIFVHELGHFMVARWYGVRVVTFSLGFGPKIVKLRRGDTEYCISAIPLGGYVKLAGETVDDQRSGAPDEFLSKSKFIRFQVYLAGPVMNLLLAFFALAAALSAGADIPRYHKQPPVIGALAQNSPAAAAGLRVGDLITSVNGRPVATWDQLDIEVVPKANRELDLGIVRDGQSMVVAITPEAVTKYELGDLGVGPVTRPQLTQIVVGSPADLAGLERYDVIVGVNGDLALPQVEVIDRIQASPGQPMTFHVERNGVVLEVPVVPADEGGTGRIGAIISGAEVEPINPTVWQAFGLSARQNWDNTLLIGRTLAGLFTAETPVRQLMGPVGIAELSGSAATLGWASLFSLMAMISLNLGLINLMPVPVLDGGHIAILAVEGLSRRDMSIRVKERMLMAGAAMLVLLMVTVIYNDVARLLR